MLKLINWTPWNAFWWSCDLFEKNGKFHLQHENDQIMIETLVEHLNVYSNIDSVIPKIFEICNNIRFTSSWNKIQIIKFHIGIDNYLYFYYYILISYVRSVKFGLAWDFKLSWAFVVLEYVQALSVSNAKEVELWWREMILFPISKG